MCPESALRRAFLVTITSAVLAFPSHAQNQYVGVQACASCHTDHLQIWQKSRHAGAVRTLANKDAVGEARQVEGLWIAKMGRGEKYGLPVPAAEFPHCLICHSTAVGADPRLVAASLDRKDGVQCEVCHGPGSAHARVETLKKSGRPIRTEEVAAALEVAKAVTFKRYAGEKEIEAFCRTCHDGMCGDFDFQKAWPQIRHSAPSRSPGTRTAPR
ncbi:MAG: multiheme c-type cytochrome [Thermoanaerobaculia bacterium]